MPFMIAAVGISALSAGMGASASNKASARNYIATLNANIATNKANDEANLLNTIRSGYRVGVLNAQRGHAKAAAVRNGYDISAKGAAVLGQSQANAAASGTTGASVDAVEEDIRRKMDESQGEVDAAWEGTQQNFDQSLNDMVQQGIDSLQSTVKPGMDAPAMQSVGGSMALGAIQAGASFAVQYGTAKMQLGLGNGGGRAVGGGLIPNKSSISGFRNMTPPTSGGGVNYSLY